MIKVKLKQLLKKKGMSMTELHELTGISLNALSLMANGKSNGIQFNTLDKILDATNANIDELIEQTGELYTLFVERQYEKDEIKEEGIKYFPYKIIARKSTGEEFFGFFNFCVKHYALDSNTVIHISFSDFSQEKREDINNDYVYNIFVKEDSSVKRPLSYIIAYDLLAHLQTEKFIEKLKLDSLVLFTWWLGNIKEQDEGTYKINLAEPDIDAAHIFDEIKFDVLPNVKNLESLSNIESVRYDPALGYCEIDIYFT